MTNKQIILYAIAAIAVIGIIGVTIMLTREPQDVRSRAQTPTTACQVPGAVQGVNISFPHCDQNDQCSFQQADCKWSTVTGATSYRITVTDENTGTVVKNETVTGTLEVVFPVTQNNTYRCDVSAVNACGEAGAAGTHSLLCAVDAAVSTPTITPTTPIQPTATLPPGITPINFTPTPIPTLPPAGLTQSSMIVGGVAAFLILIGGLVFIF